jgi:hypothetical protein
MHCLPTLPLNWPPVELRDVVPGPGHLSRLGARSSPTLGNANAALHEECGFFRPFPVCRLRSQARSLMARRAARVRATPIDLTNASFSETAQAGLLTPPARGRVSRLPPAHGRRLLLRRTGNASRDKSPGNRRSLDTPSLPGNRSGWYRSFRPEQTLRKLSDKKPWPTPRGGNV